MEALKARVVERVAGVPPGKLLVPAAVSLLATVGSHKLQLSGKLLCTQYFE